MLMGSDLPGSDPSRNQSSFTQVAGAVVTDFEVL